MRLLYLPSASIWIWRIAIQIAFAFCIAVFLCAPLWAQQTPVSWRSPDWAGSAPIESTSSNGFRLSLPQGRSWAAALQTYTVDLNKTPLLSVTVRDRTPGASWVLKLGDTSYDPTHPQDTATTPAGGDKPGQYLVDLTEVSGNEWQGQKSIEVRLFVVGSPGAQITFGEVSFLPRSRESSYRSDGTASLASGVWTLRYRAEEKRLLLSHHSAYGGISLPLPDAANITTSPTISTPNKNTLALRTTTEDTEYEMQLTASPATTGTALFHWTVDARWLKPHPFPKTILQPECRYEAMPGITAPLYVLSSHRFGQMGLETGQAFLPNDAALNGTALYFQNLTSLSPLLDATHTSARKTVQATPDGFGFSLPIAAGTTTAFPAGTKFRITDTYLALNDRNAASPPDAARLYLNLLATIYDALPNRPATIYTDWQNLADRSLVDLLDPLCWSNPDRGYLRNYVGEPWPPHLAELTVQIDPLVAALSYEAATKRPLSTVTQRLISSLPNFYDASLHCIRDYNTEDKSTRADSWYRIYPLIQLARAAKSVPEAKTLVQDSLDATIAFAHKCGYHFPVFFNPQTLGDFVGEEPDCGGAYAYLMLQAYDLFGQDRYLTEARNAAAQIAPYGLNYAYELHLTALSVTACARLWKITGDASYLDLSLVPLANVLRHCWIYEPGYGYHKENHLFFSLSAMSGAYTAPFEQYQAWLALREYEEIAQNALPYPAHLLVSEFLKYGQTNLRYMYPSFMPSDMLAPTNERGGKNAPNLLIPVEDVNDGWEKAGKIGQELYGCGGPLTIAARAYARIPEAGLTLFSEYPIREKIWNPTKHILRLRIGGVATQQTLVVVRYDSRLTGWSATRSPRIQVVQGTDKVQDRHNETGILRFRVAGETTLLIDIPLSTVTPSPKSKPGQRH